MLKDNISDKNKLSRGINYFINLYNVGKKDEILSSENYILQNYSDNSILYNLIGIVAFETGNNKKAIEYFKKVLNLDPFNPHAHNNLGVALWNLKEFKKAKSVFRKAIAINPQSFEAFHNLGNIFFEEGKVLIAIDKLKKSLEINPKYERAAIKLFEILTAFNSKVAYSEFKNFLRKNPNSFMVSHMFAQFLESQDNLVEAINYYENSIKCNHNYYPSYNNLGIIFSKTNVEKAYDIFKKRIKKYQSF